MPDITEAVLGSSSHKICVIAGPGCRKTTGILIPKANQILSDVKVAGEQVLLLTFSRLSALDLKRRSKALDRAPRASTVHSFCLSFLLSENNHDIRSRVDSIILDFERDVLISDLKLIFPGKKKSDLRESLNEFSAGWATKPHDEVFEQNDEQRSFKNSVVNWLVEHEAAMMEEIVYHAVDLAKQLPDAKVLAEPQFIFVDEFQDLNQLEQQFITQLARVSQLLLVVGDPDQSIYSFKYAHPAGIRDFAATKGVESHYSLVTWRCPRKIVERANQLLLHADPKRTELLSTPSSAVEGDIKFVRKEFQTEEFDYVLQSIAEKLKHDKPKEILVLVPRRKLGTEFVTYAEAAKKRMGISESTKFCFSAKHKFGDTERETILLFSLLARPKSTVHWRAYLGCGDDNHFAAEIKKVKEKYGTLKAALEKASADDFPKARKRVRSVCSKVARVKEFIESQGNASLESALNSLFPVDRTDLAEVRQMIVGLKEEGDTIKSLYDKFVDYIRTLPEDEHTIRVMTLIGSKGLDANHVFIVGCNAGNMPGDRWSEHITDSQHRDEQRRLLYVGFTRAKRCLSVSWSRRIPFSQSKGHNTPSVRTVTHGGVLYGEVGISDFLQDLRVSWE